jgi:hydrogenase-4 component B
MTLLLAAVIVLVVTGGAAVLTRQHPRIATLCGITGPVVAAVLGLMGIWPVFAGAGPLGLSWPWSVPNGSFTIGVDAISAFFLLPVLVIPALAAIYGSESLERFARVRSLGESWFFFNLLMAGMVMVVISRNALLFLMSWEVMALASYFLVVFDSDREAVRDAGWTYLIASHLGAAFLLPLFLVLGQSAGSLEFADMAAISSLPPGAGNLVFLLAVVGFGTKIGWMPLHVWLPDTYQEAPAHTPSVLSGVMSKMGIYGLIRVLTLLPDPPLWWGWLLIVVGALSGFVGILYAAAQHDLRRLLAYSSIENVGIIAIGLGTGLLGLSSHHSPMAVIGFGGALLHVLNHSMFKSLLFFGAGVVSHATGTSDVNSLGGLIKRMPWVATSFAVGCVAICGLPPFNGFTSEFLIYLSAFYEEVILRGVSGVSALAGIAALAIIGGAATACFTMALGIVFLGSPRTPEAAAAKAPGWRMQLPMYLLAAGCLLVGLLAPRIVGGLAPLVQGVTHYDQAAVAAILQTGGEQLSAADLIGYVVQASTGMLILLGLIVAFRWWLLRGRTVVESVTWGCGYRRPTTTMQYTGSSFVQPLLDVFFKTLWTRKTVVSPAGLFPPQASFSSETPDACKDLLYRPVFRQTGNLLARLRWLQHGRVHLYVLYLTITILVLLVWQFGVES